MKKTLLIVGLLISSLSFGQAPQGMTYQSVIRNSTNNLVTSSPVGIQISILQGSATGSAAYIERHTPTTNANGLATIEIGNGTPVAGTFAGIDWSNGPYFVKTETDPNGGTTYSISGTNQLLSVPYALYAENSGSNFSGDYNDLTNAPTNVSAFTNDAGYITSPNDADSDPTNEIQSLQLTGSSLTITGGNTVTLPGGGNTLDQAYDQGGAGVGRTINADAGEVEIIATGTNAVGLRTTNAGTGVGVLANNTGASNTFSTIQASTNSNSNIASAVVGNSSGVAWGVSGQVQSTATAEAAVYGSNLRTTGGHGVMGIGFNGTVGQTNYSQGMGVYGENFDQIAPFANGIGTAGKGYYGVFGEDRYLGGMSGAYGVFSNGNLGATGTKTFLIDHPEAPEDKFLRHFSTESNEVLNVYRGNIEIDANGEAVIELPSYYDAINTNPSYHLTPIGGFAQLYVKEEIKDGKFVIAGGTPGLKVSWAVYSERNDAYLQTYPEQREVEVEKREGQKGKYLMPELHGGSAEDAIFPTTNTELVQPEIKLN